MKVQFQSKKAEWILIISNGLIILGKERVFMSILIPTKTVA
ncbi:hypothetical protein BRLA_c021520 [Brevibacillus laterosporus LMG 15441]|uniref:Uncharacterized protein n=1 Tax=Brevibacillus laterosporus LMG 15441 TaxID=1042163 RepID=A0A075R5M9_BRELA|nr:hypothetical protein BRLA_c021520 [Brevibacillus laterosporus LMG 15441]